MENKDDNKKLNNDKRAVFISYNISSSEKKKKKGLSHILCESPLV